MERNGKIDRQIGDKRNKMKVKNCVYLKFLYKQQKEKMLRNKRKRKLEKHKNKRN